MSSRLPTGLRDEVLDESRDRRGRARCADCGHHFPDAWLQIDHITPEVDGGGHERENLAARCAPPAGGGCHRRKTAQEARRRARERRKAAARQPGWRGAVRRVKRWAHLAAIGWCLVGLRWAWLDWWGRDADAGHLLLIAREATIGAAVVSLGSWAVVWAWRAGTPPRTPTAAVVEPEAVPVDADEARIIEAARTVLGQQGAVTVTDVERIA